MWSTDVEGAVQPSSAHTGSSAAPASGGSLDGILVDLGVRALGSAPCRGGRGPHRCSLARPSCKVVASASILLKMVGSRRLLGLRLGTSGKGLDDVFACSPQGHRAGSPSPFLRDAVGRQSAEAPRLPTRPGLRSAVYAPTDSGGSGEKGRTFEPLPLLRTEPAGVSSCDGDSLAPTGALPELPDPKPSSKGSALQSLPLLWDVVRSQRTGALESP